MHMVTRNVNTAFKEMLEVFTKNSINHEPEIASRDTRNGPVLQIDEPVIITYTHPRERVLFNQSRDANCFFHLYEALWMLSGRNDVASLAYYASNIKNYSDDGSTFNGAYGYRWRKAGPDTMPNWIDQLDILVNHLKADPTSRRAVLAMWNVEDDLLKIGANPDRSDNAYNPDLKHPPSKDVCCNLNVMFSIRETAIMVTTEDPEHRGGKRSRWVKDGIDVNHPCYVLDMTVTNRSNDLVWGMLGANYVHFTILQEYMATRLGVEVGRYYHMSNNLHVYTGGEGTAKWEPELWLAWENGPHFNSYFPGTLWKSFPLVKDPVKFEKELPRFVEMFSGKENDYETLGRWDEPFFQDVAAPMMIAFRQHKLECHESAMEFASQIKADDWRIVATNWFTKRLKNKEKTNG